ncbi:MAG: hypothetical protein ABIT58_11200, partial [Ferruginibacter sp.]
RLGVHEMNAGSFFAGYGSDTGKLWKSFLDTISIFAVNHDCREAVISGSLIAFSSIYEFFEAVQYED